MRRRDFLEASIAAWLAGLVSASAARRGGRGTIGVLERGARGDGRHDDTRAFQIAIDGLGRSGGVVDVPPGEYLIDPLRSVRLRSGVHLRLAPGARLVAIANAAERAYVLLAENVRDVRISGGEILGERDRHRGRGGEWGHGLMIRGSSRVTVRDLRISRCWGDGISIGASGRGEGIASTDILIENVACRGNRRQGLTIGRSRRVRVFDSEFSGTQGTKPEYGIDIEPDHPGSARDVRIERCLVRGNRGGGIQAYRRVSDVAIVDCTIEGNGYGIFVEGAVGGRIADNRISGNRHAGVAIRGRSSGYRIEGNYFRDNGASKARETARGSPARGSSRRGHIQVAGEAGDIAIRNNRYE